MFVVFFRGEEGGEDDWPEDIKQSYKATYKDGDKCIQGRTFLDLQTFLYSFFEKPSLLPPSLLN